jgi:molybdopterin biosynthesis enzyme
MKRVAVDTLIRSALAVMPLPAIRPIAPEEAVGRLVAVPVLAPGPLPPVAIALREGLAVHAEALVGAGPQTPVMLMKRPRLVRPGDAMPAGSDALLDPEAAFDQGAFLEITESAVPGLHIRQAGADLASGAVIARTGARLSPEQAMAARMAGIESVAIVDLTAALEGFDAPLAMVLGQSLKGCGFQMVAPGEALVRLVQSPETAPRLALQPGETGGLRIDNGQLVFEVPPRFDGALGMLLAFLLPLVCRWTGAQPLPVSGRLGRKISAAIGMTEIVLLRGEDQTLTPLAMGEITLATLLAADGFLVVPPDVEGFAAGETITACRLAPLIAS